MLQVHAGVAGGRCRGLSPDALPAVTALTYIASRITTGGGAYAESCYARAQAPDGFNLRFSSFQITLHVPYICLVSARLATPAPPLTAHSFRIIESRSPVTVADAAVCVFYAFSLAVKATPARLNLQTPRHLQATSFGRAA